jgi:hypothetical protein
MRISKVPEWLRWVLFLPVAVVALAVVYPIVQFGNDILSPVEHGVLFQVFKIIAASGTSGFAFIWCGAKIAPRKQFLIATIMTSFYILLSVLMWVAKIQTNGVITTPWYEFIAVTVIGSIGCILASITIKNHRE